MPFLASSATKKSSLSSCLGSSSSDFCMSKPSGAPPLSMKWRRTTLTPSRRRCAAARVATSWVGKQAVAVQSTPKKRTRVPVPSTKWPPLTWMKPCAPAGVPLSALRSTRPLGASIPRAGNGNHCPGSWSSPVGGFVAAAFVAAAGGGAGTLVGRGEDGAGPGMTQVKKQEDNSSTAATNLVEGLTPLILLRRSAGTRRDTIRKAQKRGHG